MAGVPRLGGLFNYRYVSESALENGVFVFHYTENVEVYNELIESGNCRTDGDSG